MALKKEFQDLHDLIKNYALAIYKIKKYPGHIHYKRIIKRLFIEINNSVKTIKRLKNEDIDFSFEKEILKLIDESTNLNDKIKLLDDIELKWQDLNLDLENIKPKVETHNIPKEITNSEVCLDLEEAINDFQNKCFFSCLVMCRRAYEGALGEKYRKIEGKEPSTQIICKHCKNIVRSNIFLGIADLHKWAIDKNVISNKFSNIGYLIPSISSGGAHPTENFPRDTEVANLVLNTTITLLKLVYSK